MIQQGELLAGKYRVERVLGAGGMGYVVAALHEQLGQRVAVKLLVPELCENEDSVTRFLREARAAVQIHSEHVARVIDVGELTNGSPYMVMEFLSGHDLAEELDLPGQLDIEVAIDYVLQASEAVAEAHSLNLIHRDLKPANLFLTHRPDGSSLVKVLDFGISKAINVNDNVNDNALEPAPSLTATHSLLGSPAYMSPEQIRRPKSVDTRTDIWSLGSILFELLARDPPFNADSPIALLAAVVSDPLPSLREIRPDVPPELEAVIAKCLEKKPEDRYQTVAELADALAPFSPRSQPSISRISGILRSASLRPVTTDKSPSDERTLQSPGTPITGDEKTDEVREVRVKIVTPASLTPAAHANSGKNTNSDWVATSSIAGRSRRRAVVLAIAGMASVVGAIIWWLARPSLTAERPPEPPTVKVGTAAAPPNTPAHAVPASPPSAAPAASVTAPEPAVTASAAATPSAAPNEPAAKAKAKAKAKPGAWPAPARPASAAPAHAAAPPAAAPPAPKPTSDPLDGRR